MDLKNYFSACCRELAVKLLIQSPSFKALTSGKKKVTTGINASFNQEDFSINIYFLESGNSAYARQTLWISFTVDSEPLLFFSLYDILSVLRPDDFNCYTYTFVDSLELMKACFNEIEKLFSELLPEIKALFSDGVRKNHLIAAQKEKVNQYFGDSIFESADFLGGRAEKLISVMIFNFFQYQIESAVIGSPAMFFEGKEEKALKRLKKSKYRSLYEDNLLFYLENGGKAPQKSETKEKASVKKGASRHGSDGKGAIKLLGFSFLFTIPVFVGLALLFIGCACLLTRDALFVSGILESLIMLPAPALLIGFAIALNKTAFKKPKKKKTDIQTPPVAQSAKAFLKYFTIAIETLAIFFLWTSINSTLAFYDDSVQYSTEVLPLSKSYCEYSSIDYIAVLNGYYYEKEFCEEPYIVIVTKSGEKLDLYNSTFLSAEKFKNEAVALLEEKGIKIVQMNSIE